jgi:hypothetical protein
MTPSVTAVHALSPVPCEMLRAGRFFREPRKPGRAAGIQIESGGIAAVPLWSPWVGRGAQSWPFQSQT